MIVINHNTKKIIAITIEYQKIDFSKNDAIGITLYKLAKKYPTEVILWVNEKVQREVDFNFIRERTKNNKRLFLSYNPKENYFPDELGYVEDSPFINVNKAVRYPTWQMSSWVGVVQASTVIQTGEAIWKQNKSFDYILNSIAKTYQSLGLFCYSEPQLLKENRIDDIATASISELFIFVRQHYKFVWVFLLFLNMMMYQNQFPLWAFFKSLFYKQIKEQTKLQFEETLPTIVSENETLDVVIPTIGRKKYLYDVLCDLRNQTHLPQNVIVVEQNPLPESTTELDFITTEKWPFKIKHIFTHKTGACQARNKALALVESKWCFLADDDIRIKNNFLEVFWQQYNFNKGNGFTLSCLLEGQKKTNQMICQISYFGSGCSIVKTEFIKKATFDINFEFGFGEDSDFGMQLRNLGCDIVYLPNPEIIHLKAPVGGFRTKFVHLWSKETIQPKPSPTILYGKLKFQTTEQIQGYRTVLFFKYYKFQKIKNPIKYYQKFQKQWSISEKWTNILKQQ